MSDPIDDQLSRFSDGFRGGDMPLSAAAVRRRGDQIRRRRNALVAGGAALAVAAVAVPVIALAGGGGDVESDRDRVATEPGGEAAAPVGPADLLTDAETVYSPGDADWFTVRTNEAGDVVALHPCAQGSLADLGATSTVQREFELRNLAPGAPEVRGESLVETIGAFPSGAAAREAYDAVAEWLLACEGRIEGMTDYRILPRARTVELPEGDALIYDLHWGPAPAELDPFGEAAYINETGLVLVGDRIAVLTSVVVGQDYNFLPEDGGTPVHRMIPSAGALLVPDDGTPSSPTPEPAAGPTRLPAGFPLGSGLPTDDGSDEFRLEPADRDNRAMIPAGELQACGESPAAGEPVDRLTTRLAVGSSAHAREIQLFGDEASASLFVDSVRQLFEGCPTEDSGGAPPVITTRVGDGSVGAEESVVVTRASDGIGRTVINVVRVGNAVLVDLVSDEGTGDSVQDLATESRENLADAIGALHDLSGRD